MKLKLEKFNKILENKNILETHIEKTKKEYRKLDPGQYLYNLMLDKRKIFDIYSDEYLELVYTTLIAWNMNGRGAKLADIAEFKETIRKNKEDINFLKGYRIEKLDRKEIEKILKILERLFEKMKVVQTKSPLVTFSKTLHFLLPDLIVPIDRRYTATFFYNSNQLPSQEKQFKVFSEVFEKFWEFSQKYNLDNYLDNTWNRTIPKIMDNIIIGYKLNKI
ncbi:MAG: hypothetical protein WC511_04605 [Candidatus Pacearchaeota archaeon]